MKIRSVLPFLFILMSLGDSALVFASFGINEFKHGIEESGASTLAQAVPILAKNLKSNFTAVYHSNSVQGGTERDPRVIFWDEGSGFAATFSGDPLGSEHDAIEMFQFDSKTARFEFLRQVFPLSKTSTGLPDFSPKREASCLSCHGKDPRPIWAEYPSWSGVFGSDNDLLKAPEKTLFESFVSYAENNLLYGALFPPDIRKGWPSYPYREETGPIAKIRNSATFRPNQRLGQLATRLNAARAMRLIRQSPNYRENIPALLYGFLGCNGNGIQQTPAALTSLAAISLLDLDLRVTFKAESQTIAELAEGPSYFDGSASMNELIASKIFEDAVEFDKSYDEAYFPRGLFNKYKPGPRINMMDMALNIRMDGLGTWIPTPFRTEEVEKKHRELFNEDFRQNWENTCAFVKKRMPVGQIAGLQPTTLAPIARPGGSEVAVKKDAFGYFQQYCARCHDGGHSNGLHILKKEDLFGQAPRLVDRIQRERMPLGRNDWTAQNRAEWERDRPLMIKALESE